MGIGAPAVLVVGSVVSLHDKLAWFERKPLFGKRILVTRSREQSAKNGRTYRRDGWRGGALPDDKDHAARQLRSSLMKLFKR